MTEPPPVTLRACQGGPSIALTTAGEDEAECVYCGTVVPSKVNDLALTFRANCEAHEDE
jgi:hypothetical protein